MQRDINRLSAELAQLEAEAALCSEDEKNLSRLLEIRERLKQLRVKITAREPSP